MPKNREKITQDDIKYMFVSGVTGADRLALIEQAIEDGVDFNFFSRR